MHLADSDPDPWDRILARKADEAPIAVERRDKTERGWWMYAGAALIVAAFITSTNGLTLNGRRASQGGPLKGYR